MKYHSKHSLVYIPLQLFQFLQFLFLFSFKIHYRTKAVVCQNILNTTAQCPAGILV